MIILLVIFLVAVGLMAIAGGLTTLHAGYALVKEETPTTYGFLEYALLTIVALIIGIVGLTAVALGLTGVALGIGLLL